MLTVISDVEEGMVFATMYQLPVVKPSGWQPASLSLDDDDLARDLPWGNEQFGFDTATVDPQIVSAPVFPVTLEGSFINLEIGHIRIGV